MKPGSCQTRIMAPPAKPSAMRAVRSCFTWSLLLLALAGCAGQSQQATAPGPSLAPNDDAAPCSQVGMASWYRGASRDRASPQDLVAAHRSLPFGHARAGHSHRNRAGHHGAYQRLGPVRPRADHRSIQGSGGPAGHASLRRGAGPARADWVGGGRPGQSVPANAVGLVAIACYRSTRSTSSAWTATHGPLNALECRSALFEPARGQG